MRELQNRVQRAVIVARGGPITREALGLDAPTAKSRDTSNEAVHLDRETLESTLARVDGNVSRAASELGISRQALYRRLGIVIDRCPR